jgi:hypothetical protein
MPAAGPSGCDNSNDLVVVTIGAFRDADASSAFVAAQQREYQGGGGREAVSAPAGTFHMTRPPNEIMVRVYGEYVVILRANRLDRSDVLRKTLKAVEQDDRFNAPPN